MARTPVLPEATSVGVLSALLRRSQFSQRPIALDPELPFKIDDVNERKARESRPWVKRGSRNLGSFPIRCVLLSRVVDPSLPGTARRLHWKSGRP
jgi:hypothetical protein